MKHRIPQSMTGRNVRLAVKNCAACGDDFQMPESLAHRYSTCSDECTSANRKRSPVHLTCEECGGTFNPPVLRTGDRAPKYCGNPCRLAALQRIPRPFKGKGEGWLDDEGHVVLAIWEGDERRVMKRSRLVVEGIVKRRLTPTEVVHHINLSPSDDRPENLWLCRDQAEHMRIHAFTERLLKVGLLNLCGDETGADEVDVS